MAAALVVVVIIFWLILIFMDILYKIMRLFMVLNIINGKISIMNQSFYQRFLQIILRCLVIRNVVL